MSRKRRGDMSRYKCEFCGSIMPYSAAAKHFKEKHPDRFKQRENRKFASVWNPRFEQDFALKDVSISLVRLSAKCPACDEELFLIANDATKKIGYLCPKSKCKITIWTREENADGSERLVPYVNKK